MPEWLRNLFRAFPGRGQSNANAPPDATTPDEAGEQYRDFGLIGVTSSWIDAIGYDVRVRRLYCRFNDGTLGYYADVPPELYEAWMNAPSKGKFLHANFYKKWAFNKV